MCQLRISIEKNPEPRERNERKKEGKKERKKERKIAIMQLLKRRRWSLQRMGKQRFFSRASKKGEPKLYKQFVDLDSVDHVDHGCVDWGPWGPCGLSNYNYNYNSYYNCNNFNYKSAD